MGLLGLSSGIGLSSISSNTHRLTSVCGTNVRRLTSLVSRCCGTRASRMIANRAGWVVHPLHAADVDCPTDLDYGWYGQLAPTYHDHRYDDHEALHTFAIENPCFNVLPNSPRPGRPSHRFACPVVNPGPTYGVKTRP
jgi:hypothetical protein